MAFEDLLVQLSSKLDESGFKKLDQLEDKAMKKTSILSKSLRRMFVGIIGTFAVKSIIDVSKRFDTLQKSMTALAGSEIGGTSQLAYLRKEADRLGQSFESVAESYKNLFAAGTSAGWSSKDIQNVFSATLETGTVLGSSQQEIDRALSSLEQMISKGEISTREITQFGKALPGTMRVAAKSMGVTTKEFKEMIKQGLKSEDFLKMFAKTLHVEYGEKATKSAHSLRAELERLNNAVFTLQVSLLDGDNMEGVASAIREITHLISSPIFLQSINAIGKLVGFLGKHIRLIIGIAVIIGIRRIIQQLILLRLELLTTTYAAGTLGIAMQAIVGGNVIAGLKTITAIFLAWLAPLLKIAAILGLIIEFADTLRGKDTATSEIIENLPTVPEFTTSEKFQRGVINIKKNMPWNKEAPLLEDSGRYDKSGNLKASNNNATIIINANSANSQQVANLVKKTVANMFNEYEEVYT